MGFPRGRHGGRRDERGVALVTAIIVLALLSGVGTTAVVFSSSGFRESARGAADQKAFSLAEAGVGLARSVLYDADDFYDPNAVPAQTVPLDGGTVTYSGTLAGTTWTLTGTGSVANPTGPDTAPVTRTISSQVSVTTAVRGSPNNAAWNYMYADDPGDCTHIHNNARVSVPLYTRGGLCLENNATFDGPLVEVEGVADIRNNASIGRNQPPPPVPIAEARIQGGCRYAGNSVPCGPGGNVYAQTISSTPSGLRKPPVDLAGWYENADLGPRNGCTVGSFPSGFDNDAQLNTSRSTVNLMPTTAYSCRRIVGGQTVGELTWTPGQGNHCGTLVVAGTIFFDGPIERRNNAKGCYLGKATIYTSGTLYLENNVYLCGIEGCTSAWDPSTNLLAIVAGGSTGTGFGIVIENNADFQGALYAVRNYRARNNADVWGPVIANRIEVENNASNSAPVNEILPGMPAEYVQVTELVNVQDSYSG